VHLVGFVIRISRVISKTDNNRRYVLEDRTAPKERAQCPTAIPCHNYTEYPHVRQTICTLSYNRNIKSINQFKNCVKTLIHAAAYIKWCNLYYLHIKTSKPNNFFFFGSRVWFCLWCSRSYTCQLCEEFQSGIFQLHFFLKFQQQAPNTSPGIVTSCCVNAFLLVRQCN
jgi:hypothetical protein